MNRIIVSLFGIMVMFGCAEADRKGQIIERLTKDVDTASKGILKFSEFLKTDGKEIQNGNLLYELQFTGFIEAKRNCCWKVVPSKGALSSYISRGLTEPSDRLYFGVSECTDTTSQSYTKESWGYRVAGKAYYEKRDSGWQLLDYIMIDSARSEQLHLQN